MASIGRRIETLEGLILPPAPRKEEAVAELQGNAPAARKAS